jgi:hypothetical protein
MSREIDPISNPDPTRPNCSGSDRIRMQHAKHYVYVYCIYKPNAVCVPMNGVNGIRGMLWYGVVANSVIVFNEIITPIYAQDVQLRNVSLTCIN